MTLKAWITGDIITAVSANNKGIRKGTTTDLDGIGLSAREIGDISYNETVENPQTTIDATNNRRGNLKMLLGADGTEVTVTGTTATQRKDISYIKDISGFSGNVITIVAELKNSVGGTTAHLRVRKDGSGSDSLDLTTNSTTYVIVSGKINIGADAVGRHTLEFYLDSGAGDTATQRDLEVYGI